MLKELYNIKVLIMLIYDKILDLLMGGYFI